jgi:hypothetical protein
MAAPTIWLAILWLVGTTQLVTPFGPASDGQVLVIVHDAGESLGLLPLVEAFSKPQQRKAALIQVNVLALGDPATSIFTEAAARSNFRLLSLRSFGIDVDIVNQVGACLWYRLAEWWVVFWVMYSNPNSFWAMLLAGNC